MKKTLNIVVIGDSGVGKSSLIDSVAQSGGSTVVRNENEVIVEWNDSISLNVIEMSSEAMTMVASAALTQNKTVSGVLIVYDVCSEQSFANVRSWRSFVCANFPTEGDDELVHFLVGHKNDDDVGRAKVVSSVTGQRLADLFGIKFFQTSIFHSRINSIEIVFEALVRAICSRLNRAQEQQQQQQQQQLAASDNELSQSSSEKHVIPRPGLRAWGAVKDRRQRRRNRSKLKSERSNNLLSATSDGRHNSVSIQLADTVGNGDAVDAAADDDGDGETYDDMFDDDEDGDVDDGALKKSTSKRHRIRRRLASSKRVFRAKRHKGPSTASLRGGDQDRASASSSTRRSSEGMRAPMRRSTMSMSSGLATSSPPASDRDEHAQLAQRCKAIVSQPLPKFVAASSAVRFDSSVALSALADSAVMLDAPLTSTRSLAQSSPAAAVAATSSSSSSKSESRNRSRNEAVCSRASFADRALARQAAMAAENAQRAASPTTSLEQLSPHSSFQIGEPKTALRSSMMLSDSRKRRYALSLALGGDRDAYSLSSSSSDDDDDDDDRATTVVDEFARTPATPVVNARDEGSTGVDVSSYKRYSLDDDVVTDIDGGAIQRGDDDDERAVFHRNATPRPVPLHEQDYNERFQRLTGQLHDLQKQPELLDPCAVKFRTLNNRLMALSKDFLALSTMYGKIIISEFCLPDNQKTLKPCDLGGRAGGTKYKHRGVVFKFAVDSESMFGGNDYISSKVAGHELKGLLAYYQCAASGIQISLPMCALLDYLGYRVIAMTLLPIDDSTLRYGSSDGGSTVLADPVFSGIMERCAAVLNVDEHVSGGKIIFSAADVEGHVGRDGRRYLLDLSRSLPPTALNSAKRNCLPFAHLYRMFRGEFLSTYTAPLCPDAFSGFISDDPRRVARCRRVVEATKVLEERVIPAAAPAIASAVGEALSRATVGASFVLATELHRHGVNVRYIGAVMRALNDAGDTDQQVQIYLLVEAVARVLKHELRSRLRQRSRELRTDMVSMYEELVVSFLNQCFGSLKELNSTAFWIYVVEDKLEQLFGIDAALIAACLQKPMSAAAKMAAAVASSSSGDALSATTTSPLTAGSPASSSPSLPSMAATASSTADELVLPRNSTLDEDFLLEGATASNDYFLGDDKLDDDSAAVTSALGAARRSRARILLRKSFALGDRPATRKRMAARYVLLLRLTAMMHINFRDGVLARAKSADFNPYRPFSTSDLLSLAVRVKDTGHMTVASANFLAAEAISGQSAAIARQMLGQSKALLESALVSSPNNPLFLLQCAQICHRLTKYEMAATSSSLLSTTSINGNGNEGGGGSRDSDGAVGGDSDDSGSALLCDAAVAADTHFLRCLRFWPDDASKAHPCFLFALHLITVKHDDRAEEYLCRALELNPNMVSALVVYANFLESRLRPGDIDQPPLVRENIIALRQRAQRLRDCTEK
jgi:GTPase SAR1 family protein